MRAGRTFVEPPDAILRRLEAARSSQAAAATSARRGRQACAGTIVWFLLLLVGWVVTATGAGDDVGRWVGRALVVGTLVGVGGSAALLLRGVALELDDRKLQAAQEDIGRLDEGAAARAHRRGLIAPAA